MAEVAIELGSSSTKLMLRRHTVNGSVLLDGVGVMEHGEHTMIRLPSLVHLGDEIRVGREVVDAGLLEDDATFKDLKDYVRHPRPVTRNVRGQRVTYKDAAARFLGEVVRRLQRELGEALDVALVCPWSQEQRCRDWLGSVHLDGARSVSLVDEDTALVLGDGAVQLTDGVLLVMDYGYSAIRCRLVEVHWYGRDAYAPAVVKAVAEVDFGVADLWQSAAADPVAEGAGELAAAGYGDWLNDPVLGSRLDRHLALNQARQALDRVFEEGALAGIGPSEVSGVFLRGGGAAMAPLRELLVETLGEKVHVDASGATAGCGGLTFLGDSPLDDRVADRYAVRMRDPITGEYHYPVVVERFTRYPSRQPTARYVVNTFYEGQTAIHLEVYRQVGAANDAAVLEAQFDAGGRVGFSQLGEQADYVAAMEQPVEIPVSPPGRTGERRLHLEFSVDNRKHLRLTVKDLREDKTVWDAKPLTGLH